MNGIRRQRAGLVLHDLTGFDGRCDAIFFSCDDAVPPEGTDSAARAWRRRLRGLPDQRGELRDIVAGITGQSLPG